MDRISSDYVLWSSVHWLEGNYSHGSWTVCPCLRIVSLDLKLNTQRLKTAYKSVCDGVGNIVLEEEV